MGLSARARAAVGVSVLISILLPRVCLAQSIEFESNGLRYQALTRSGMTIMFAPLRVSVREYAIIQVAVSNGSPSTRTVKPEDFRFERGDGMVINATPARRVVEEFLTRAGRNDVIRLVKTYEMALYGLPRFASTNGYEARREAAHAEVDSAKLKAAAAASAIAFVPTKLAAGQSTDGAVFFATSGKPLGTGKLVVTPGVELFEFEVSADKRPGQLVQRP
jgi:hypothetical protein